MSNVSMEAATADRLESYRFKPTLDGDPVALDPAIIETVAEVADRQASYGANYAAFLEDIGGDVSTHEAPNGKPYQVLDVRRDEEDGVVSYHLPMANPLDPNQRFQIATIAAVNPHKRVIAIGNPSGGAYRSGQLTRRQRTAVARGEFTPLIEADRQYLDRMRIDTADQVGYSFGADKAAQLASGGDIVVPHLVVIEPVTGHRSLLELARDFNETAEALDEYATAPSLESFDAARADSLTDHQYARGLSRPTNVAIARGLALGSFGTRLRTALHAQLFSRMHTTVAWGTLSELCHMGSSRQLLLRAVKQQGGSDMGVLLEANRLDYHDPVTDMKLALGRHALGNDIHLQAAIVTQGLTSRY